MSSHGNGQQVFWTPEISEKFNSDADIVLVHGDSAKELCQIPSQSISLVITSPPYNLGKVYEQATNLDKYLNLLSPILKELVRALSPAGSLCWQVGNCVQDSEVFPLDIYYYPLFKNHGLKLRNRIIWKFEHGLHATKRFSGRYE